MRVDKSDLDEIVVEDGETTISPKLDVKGQDLNKMVHRQEIGTLGNVQSASTGRKPREPVEDTEDAEDFKGFGQNSVDDLTKALTVCSLASEEEKSSHTLEKTFASLVVSGVACTEDKDENSDSHSSIITIDPPSLPHVKEDADGEPFDEVISRGPTSGKPVCFSQKSCNRIAEKSYYSHNFDKYFAPLQAGEEKPQCFQSQINRNYCSNLNPPFMTDTIHTGNFTFEVNSGTKSGKRQNPDGDVPFKYIRPNMESEISQQNNLNFEMNSKRPIYPQVMSSIGPGAQVMDNSPEVLSPTSELVGSGWKFDTQLSMTEGDNFLAVINQYPQPEQCQKKSEVGYRTDTCFFSQKPQWSQAFAPERSFEFNQINPEQQHDFGYVSENSPPCETFGSPSSSPKSTYSPPPSNKSQESQDSGIASPLNEDSMFTTMPSPASEYSMYNNDGGHTTATPRSSSADPVTWSCYQYGPAAYGSPPSTMLNEDASMLSAASPSAQDLLDPFFEQHQLELKDALEVVANDIKVSSKKSVLTQNITNLTPASTASNMQPGINMIPQVAPAPPISSPVITSEGSGRPSKLPLPPLPKNGTVPVIPTTAPAPNNQSYLLIPNGGYLLVVQPTPKQPPKPQFVPIKPKIPTSSPSMPCKTEAISVDTEPKVHKVPSTSDNCSISTTSVTVSGQTPCIQPTDGKSGGKKPCGQNRNVSQQKMLNVARRLVASMTKEDLQFQDAEGDTYLHVSVCKADRNMVQALLERLSREKLPHMINVQNCMRQTPLYLAVSANHPEMVELLIEYGADVNLFAEHTLADGRSKEVKAALHCAASHGAQYLQTLQALLASKELNIDLVNSDGHTALHCAILEHNKPQVNGIDLINNLPIIQALIKHGADPNAQGKKSGKTALMYAFESRDIVLIEHIVALISPDRLRTYLKTQAFDSSTCHRIAENLQRSLDPESRHRLQACLKISGARRENCPA